MAGWRTPNSVTSERVAIHFELDLHGAGAHPDRYVFGTAHSLYDAANVLRFLLKEKQAVTKNLDTQLSLDAGNHLSEAHRHRRAELIFQAGNLSERGVHPFDKRVG